MGSSNSAPTREFSMKNEETVRISENVARRIVNVVEKGYESTEKENIHKTQEREREERHDINDDFKPASDRKFDDMVTRESLRDEEIQKRLFDMESNYKQKISNLDSLNDKLLNVATEEFKRTVTSISEKFSHHIGKPICDGHCQNVIECYKSNSKETLKCSKIVSEFTECVRNEHKKY